MLNKSEMRPAYAGVNQGNFRNDRADTDYAVFSAAQTEDDDFNSFGDTSSKTGSSSNRQRQTQNQKQQRKPKRKKKPSVSPKMLAIGAGVLVALVLVIALFVAVFSSPGKDIIMEDDVYATYVDTEGVYHVVFNGKEIKHTFEGKVDMQLAADNSFAYLFEEVVSEEGASAIRMYVLEGKKLTAVEAEADEILKCAEYEPGIIFKHGNIIQFFSKNAFEDISNDPAAKNFVISGDATTVVFTEPANRNRETTQVKYFRNAGFNNIGETSGLTPVAISKDGKHVYATDSTGSFYYLKVTKRGAEYEQKTIVTNSQYTFGEVTELNADGTEVIFTYTDNVKGATASFIYKIGDKSPSQIAAGVFRYTPIDKEVACPSTFIDSAFTVNRTVTTEDEKTMNITSTYYYTRKGARRLADAEGVFSPDGKYFYYLDYGKLCRVSLASDDFEKDKEELSSTVDAFALTEKGDIYTYRKPTADTAGNITRRKADKTKSRLISVKVDADSMFVCGNSIFFSETVGDDVKIYKAVEDAVKEEITFKKTIADSYMTIVMGTKDKGYAYFTDIDGNTKLLYTANAKSFDIICDSCTLPGASSDTATPPATNNSNNDEDSAG